MISFPGSLSFNGISRISYISPASRRRFGATLKVASFARSLRAAICFQVFPQISTEETVVIHEIDGGIVVDIVAGEAIAHGDALQVYRWVGCNLCRQRGHIDTGIAFTLWHEEKDGTNRCLLIFRDFLIFTSLSSFFL